MARHPQYDVDALQLDFSELREGVTKGRIDVMLTASYDCIEFENSAYRIAPFRTVPLMAYMDSCNPLAEKDSLAIEDVCRETLLMVAQKSSPGYGTYIKKLYERNGFQPRIAQYASSGGEHMGNLLLGKGPILASECFLKNSLEDQIARIPIEGETIDICIVWKKDNENPVLQLFLKECFGSLDGSAPASSD